MWEPETYDVRWLFKVPFISYALWEKRVVFPARLCIHGDRELPPDIAAKIPERPNIPELYAMPMEELRKLAFGE